jgi:hypothetical protein
MTQFISDLILIVVAIICIIGMVAPRDVEVWP